MRRGLALGAVLVAWMGVGTAAAAGSWRTVTLRADGFAIAVPRTWQVVPRSTPRLDALVATLRKAGRTKLALQFQEIAAARRASHLTYRFQAFAWPAPKGPVVPDVTVKTDRLRAGTTGAALPAIARSIAKALSRSAHATADAPVRRTLPAGRAVEVTGTTQVSKTIRSRYAVYLLIHGAKLYSLSFRGPATTAQARIVESFRFT